MAKEQVRKSCDRDPYLARGYITGIIASDDSFERKLKSYNREREFNRFANSELRDKGIAWFESGLSLEDAPEELRNDEGFKIGFEIGRRRAYARELDEIDKTKKSK